MLGCTYHPVMGRLWASSFSSCGSLLFKPLRPSGSAPINIVQTHQCSFQKKLLSERISRPFSSSTKTPVRPSELSKAQERDILLYKYENPRYFRYLNLFGYTMWCVGFVAASEFWEMKIDENNEDNSNLPWFARFKFRSEIAKNCFAALTAFVGIGCLAVSWLYSLRSVQYLVLMKGRKEVSFVTYNPAPFKRHMLYKAKLSDISCQGSRELSNLLPVKVRGKWFHFLLNKEGSYLNGPLFDKTVGVHRSF